MSPYPELKIEVAIRANARLQELLKGTYSTLTNEMFCNQEAEFCRQRTVLLLQPVPQDMSGPLIPSPLLRLHWFEGIFDSIEEADDGTEDAKSRHSTW